MVMKCEDGLLLYGKEVLYEPHHNDIQSTVLLVSEMTIKSFVLVYKLPSLWYFAVAAPSSKIVLIIFHLFV